MIEFSLPVAFEAVDALDEVLLERGDSRWSIAQDLPSRSARLIGFFETGDEAAQAWSELAQHCASQIAPAQGPQLRDVPEQEWRDSYKIHFKAWQFGRLHWVPVWERDTYALPAGDAVLWLDPGLAFGTGNHETTRLCVERLVALRATQFGVWSSEFGVEETLGSGSSDNSKPQIRNSKLPTPRVIDAGCGSGILALSAVKLGFQHVVAFDNDPEAVRVSEENAALNQLTGRVDFFVGDLITGLADRTAEIVLANIQADVLQRFARELTQVIAPGGALILSGILAKELDQVRTTFAASVPTWTIDSRIMGEWSDLHLVRPEGL